MRLTSLARLLTLMCIAGGSPVALSGQSADSTAVMRTLDRMLVALRTKDADGLRATFHNDVRMTLLRPAPDGSTRVVVLTGEQFISIATNANGPALDEPVRNPRLSIDGDLATVWAEYQVRIAGAVSHCGYDAFQFVRAANEWKILSVADTFRRTGCGDMWK
jgi:hypothetical protein